MDNLTSGNPVAHAVRVYYEGSSKIYEGMPVCYNYRTTENWFGGSVSDGVITATNTTAEGSHNESKYIRVVNPAVVSTSATGTATAGVIADANLATPNLPGVGTYVYVTGTNMTDGVYKVTAVSTGVSITVDAGSADVTGTSVSVTVDNRSNFAGVVKKGGWCGKTGPRVLDIYVPNGAVVPVRNDQNCVVGRTVLAISSDEQHLTAPLGSYARSVAIAWETVDTATTTGLCLAKLDSNMFIYQSGDSGSLQIDDQDTGNTIVNNINISSLQASGWVQALSIVLNTATVSNYSGIYIESGNTGLGTGGFHVINLYGEAAGTAITADVNGIKSQMNLLAGAGLSSAGIAAGIFGKAEVKSGAGTIAGDVVGGRFSVGHGATVTGDTAMLYFDHTGSNIDYFFKTPLAAAVAQNADGGTATGATCGLFLEILVNDVSYWIPTYTAAELAS